MQGSNAAWSYWEHFLRTCRPIPDRRLSDLPLVTGRQRQLLLADWNATAREYAEDCCIHELFEAQVERTPSAPAVVYRAQALSYRDLNRRANQLARRLQSLGVGPGKFVGIFLQRSLDLVVAMLATLKAGAAYVPMDPSYPRQRLAVMLEDSRASVVLTQADLRSTLPFPGRPGRLPGRAQRPRLADGARYERGERGASSRPGLCHFHLRLEWVAQGRDGGAPERHQLLHRHGRMPGFQRAGNLAGGYEYLLRYFGARAFVDVGPWLQGGDPGRCHPGSCSAERSAKRARASATPIRSALRALRLFRLLAKRISVSFILPPRAA